MAARSWSIRRPGPVARLSFGLVALIVSLVMALDLFFGLVPTRLESQRAVRSALAGALGVQAATLLEQGDRAAVESAFAKMLDRSRDVASLALRRDDGQVAVQTPKHAALWEAPPDGKSTNNHVRVPLLADGQPWGDLEISFVRLDSDWITNWWREPLFMLVLLLGTIGVMLVFLYIRRALEFLDPAAAVPEHVRQAFDTFVDAVVIVDAKGRLVLANEAFRRLTPELADHLYGKPLDAVHWLTPATNGQPSWIVAMMTGRPVSGLALNVPGSEGSHRRALLSCSPINNHSGATRGCLITLHDVTELQHANEQLREALLALEASRAEIEEKNAELEELATRDGLTGCLNRRAFVEQATQMLQQARDEGRALACVMIDIDHFKSINDRFGHSFGDRVIRSVANTLMRNLRGDELLGRYGGEEFCIVIPDIDGRQARVIAERLRHALEVNVGPGLRTTEPVAVTVSIGVAGLISETRQLDSLIDSADAALYESKRNGRNRVTLAAANIGAARAAPMQA